MTQIDDRITAGKAALDWQWYNDARAWRARATAATAERDALSDKLRNTRQDADRAEYQRQGVVGCLWGVVLVCGVVIAGLTLIVMSGGF